MQAEIYEKCAGGQSRLPPEDADQVIDAVAAAGGEFGKRPVVPGILRNRGGQLPDDAAVLRFLFAPAKMGENRKKFRHCLHLRAACALQKIQPGDPIRFLASLPDPAQGESVGIIAIFPEKVDVIVHRSVAGNFAFLKESPPLDIVFSRMHLRRDAVLREVQRSFHHENQHVFPAAAADVAFSRLKVFMR